MLKFVVLMSLPYMVFCLDAVIWTNDKNQKSSLFDNFDLNEQLIDVSLDKPFVIFLVEKFTLADFSRFAKVYSDPAEQQKTGLTKWLRSSEGYTVEYLSESIQLPSSQIQYKTDTNDQSLTSAAAVIVKLNDLTHIDEAANRIFSLLGSKPYLAVLTASDVTDAQKLSHNHVRVVRQAEVTDATEQQTTDTPTQKPTHKPTDDQSEGSTVPMFNNNTGQCIIYMKQPYVMVKGPKFDGDNKDYSGQSVKYPINGTWVIDVECDSPFGVNLNETKFTITMTAIEKYVEKPKNSLVDKMEITSLTFMMQFVTTKTGYWLLSYLNVTELKGNFGQNFDTSNVGFATKRNALTMYSVPDFCWVCQMTDPIKLTPGAQKPPKTGEKVPQVYLMFSEFQVQPFDAKDGLFNEDNTDDCAPVFSAAIWMGIITMLIMVFFLFFAISMISNLQTQERFDDPKGKPLQINAKE